MKAPSPMDDCARPACDDVKTMFHQALAASNSDAPKVGASKPKSTKKGTTECPPGSATLGRGSWTLLHTMGAWYPDKPSSAERTSMKNFIEALAYFYPCTYCAADFQENLREKPVTTQSRTEVCQWLCEQHNLVNEKLGKPKFSCDMPSLDERWRKSRDPACQNGEH